MKFVKHINSMDVCYEITNSDDHDFYLISWNMGQNTAFQITTESFAVPKTKILDGNWSHCVNYKDILDNDKSFHDGVWVGV
jgi:hypothetical protein